MVRKTYEAKNVVASGPYSNAVDAGELIFFSGQTAKNSASASLTDDIGEQTRQCFRNLFEALQATNLSPDDVVKVNVFLTDMNDLSAMNEVYKEYFDKPYPARTCVAVLALPLGAKVEIEMIAKKTDWK